MTKKYEVIWADTAEFDLAQIIERIASESPGSALENLRKIKEKTLTLHHSPGRGRIVPELQEHDVLLYRELIISTWRIIYRVGDKHVYVLSVLDSRQNVEDILFKRLTGTI